MTQEQLKNNLFLTIKGKNNNGFKFIPDALKKGKLYSFFTKQKIFE